MEVEALWWALSASLALIALIILPSSTRLGPSRNARRCGMTLTQSHTGTPTHGMFAFYPFTQKRVKPANLPVTFPRTTGVKYEISSQLQYCNERHRCSLLIQSSHPHR